MRRARRHAALVGLLAAASPGSASAAPFGELPFRPVDGAATCLRATGEPGELVSWSGSGAWLSSVRDDAIWSDRALPLAGATECPVVASAPGGPTVLAAVTRHGVQILVRRPPGYPERSVSERFGTWGEPATIPAKDAGSVQVAVSRGGDLLVVWGEPDPSARPKVRVRAVRQPAGGALGAPEAIGDAADDASFTAAIGGDGTALVALADNVALRLATGAPGAPFGAPRSLDSDLHAGSRPALVTGADGRSLLVVSAEGQVVVFERDAAGQLVRHPPIETDSDGFEDVAAALGDTGAAVVAWGSSGDSVWMVDRGAGAAFGAPVKVTPGDAPPSGGTETTLSAFFGGDGAPYDGPAPLRASLDAGGRALLTWTDSGQSGYRASVTSGQPPEVERVGTTLRDPWDLTPLVLADGTTAVAWTDNAPISLSPSAGRIHVAREGAPAAPDAPAPDLTVLAPLDASLRPAQSLALPVRCSAACDVRIETPLRLLDPGATRSHAGTSTLRIQPLSRPIAPAKPGTVTLKLTWSSPGSHAVERRSVRVRLRRAPAPAFPHVRRLRATRRGGSVDVRWSTDTPAQDVQFYVTGSRDAAVRESDSEHVEGVPGRGRKRFHVTLRNAARVRYVRLEAYELAGRQTRSVRVRVR